ncbi:homoserine/Threonine efflux family protein [Yersinia rochesterensis]|uniref:Homoserine/Threonine efflux family protein n=1 Tax=Yersinia rochesterensis TaxID=1604335 RepID=A0ABM5SJA1_9GAMM|nr:MULTISPECIES: threonine export protein RhtC [Yersinia]AJI87869.1 threonine efflux protein [Yersinia frederiksenii Y225]CNH98660.1 threonine efflux system [Yersinia kristensenii]AIN18314.1 homoserine/Threonine efflux family protein [Yersinia rochesterensis]AJJ34436.1 homoserine/Threonine efflux family protein [Yersinia rochesterensis]CRY62304.1 threonine efflux system [Yersinia kristensenii]
MLMLFLTVALVHLVALMSPGPDFFFVSQTAASRSRREAMMGVVGISLGIVVWAGVALMGLNLILQKMAWLHEIIMVGGGLYLCWMGWQLLKSARSKQDTSESEVQVALPARGRTFVRGFLTNLSNPKAVIYFGSVFSLFVGDNVTAGARWGLFVLIVAETFIWFSIVACVFALPVMRRGYQRLSKWIDGLAGVLFTGFGIHLILSR